MRTFSWENFYPVCIILVGASFIMWNLICSVKPNCGQQQFVHLGGEHVSEALGGPVQRDPPEEEDREHKVGEEGSEVNHL